MKSQARSAIAIQLQYHYDCLLKGTVPATPEPEGPFKTEEEKEWYDLLVSERKRIANTSGPGGPGGASTASQLTVTNSGYQNQQQVNNALLNIPLNRTLWVKSGSTLQPRKGDPNRPWPSAQAAHDAAAPSGDVIRVTASGTGIDAFGRQYYTETYVQTKNVLVVNEVGVIHGPGWLMGTFAGRKPFSYTIIGGEFLGPVYLCRQSGGKSKLVIENAKFTGPDTRIQGIMNTSNPDLSYTDKIELRNCLVDSDRPAGSNGPIRSNGRQEYGGSEIVLYNTPVTTTGSPCITSSSTELSWVTLLGSTVLNPGPGYSAFESLDTNQGYPAVPESTWLHDKRPGLLTAQAFLDLTDTAASTVSVSVVRNKLVLKYDDNGAGAPGSETATASKLGIDADDLFFKELTRYAADGTTITGNALTLNIAEVINQVRTAIVGTVTPSPSGDKQNVAAPTGNTLDFLRLQTFVPPAPFVLSDMEYAYGANLAATTAYQSPIALGPEARPLGYINARVKGTATRNPSAWTKSLAVDAILAQPVNYLPHSINFADFAYFGDGAFDAGNTALAPDGSMTAMKGRNYNSGTINFNQATGLLNGNIYDLSVFVKPDDISVITGAQIFTNDNQNISVFKFAELQATMLTPTIKSVSINDMSSVGEAWAGWYKLDTSFQLQGNAIDYKLRLFGGYGGVWVWAPQINDGLVRTTTVATS